MAWAMTVLAAVVGALVFERLEVPAGALLGSMLAVTVLKLTGAPVRVAPDGGRFVAFVILGWLLGQGFTREILREMMHSLVPIAVVVVALLVFGGVVAVILAKLGVVDPATAFLAASPGALTTMAALAADTGANAPVVVSVHLARLLAILAVAPFVVRHLSPG